jgi:hypothetical protein
VGYIDFVDAVFFAKMGKRVDYFFASLVAPTVYPIGFVTW